LKSVILSKPERDKARIKSDTLHRQTISHERHRNALTDRRGNIVTHEPITRHGTNMPLLNRGLSLPIRLLASLLALYVLGVSAYHIHQRRPNISSTLYAVTIISGVSAIWAILSAMVICCAKRPSLLLPMVLLDLVYMGGFIAIAVLLRRDARTTCRSSKICKVDKTAFALSVANA